MGSTGYRVLATVTATSPPAFQPKTLRAQHTEDAKVWETLALKVQPRFLTPNSVVCSAARGWASLTTTLAGVLNHTGVRKKDKESLV